MKDGDEHEVALIRGLARHMRGSLASLRAAAEALERFPGMDSDQRQRLHTIVADESARLGELVGRLEALERRTGQGDRWRIDASALVDRIRDALAQPGLEVEWMADSEAGPPSLALELDHDTMALAFRGFAAALRKDFAVVHCWLRAEEVDQHLLVDCAWRADASEAARLQDWQGEALEIGRDAPALRPTARDHGGEAWFDLDRSPEPDSRRAHVRVLLPVVDNL